MVFFDVLHAYYLPQYRPVAAELKKRGHSVTFVVYAGAGLDAEVEKIEKEGFGVVRVEDSAESVELYRRETPDWVVFGNAFSDADKLKGYTKTALMQHGIGPKSCYYTVSDADIDVRFVEGQYRLRRLQEMYPQKAFIDTGFAKLDPIIRGQECGFDLLKLGLDPHKKTVLYAPTFYPSSIELLPMDFPMDFSAYNILLKPHFFSLTSGKYGRQRKRLLHWASFDNVYLAGKDELNLLPFMASADLLISDASSAIFEFAALDKPVVWCNFFKLRWGYRGVFRYRFVKRMDRDLYRCADIAPQADSYKDLLPAVHQQLEDPGSYSEQRKKYTAELAGEVDGRCSERIVDYLLS